MSTLVLSDHIRLCRTHADTVGLDLNRNRYFCLGDRETQVMVTLGVIPIAGSKNVTVLAPELSVRETKRIVDALIHAGIVVCVHASIGIGLPDESASGEPVALSSAGYEHNDCAPVRPHHVMNFIRAWVWARRVLRKRSLYSVFEEMQSARRKNERATAHSFHPAHATALVGTFRILRPFVYSARERCLLHALVLARFLRFYDEYPRWVIGVRTRPWAAHSWLQHNGLILNARPDDVCDYTPILVV
jgi:hypothetical protein